MTSLEISHLTVSYGERKILDDLSLSINSGEIAALLGPSGCGKTTLLRTIAGLVHPTLGTIRFGNQLVGVSSLVLQVNKRKIGYVPQEGALFPHLNVAKNIAFGLRNVDISKDEARSRVSEMLAMISMFGFEKRMPSQLSGGQQTRVALARALVIQPQIVLLDEPFSALDAQLRNDLRSEVIALLREHRITALLVTHDREEALVAADIVALMREGKIVQDGSPENVYQFPGSPSVAISTGDALILDAQQYENGLTTFPLSPDAPSSRVVATGEVVIRPEEIKVHKIDQSSKGIRGRICKLDYYGHDAMLEIELDGTSRSIQSRIPGPVDMKVGEEVRVEHVGPIRFFARA